MFILLVSVGLFVFLLWRAHSAHPIDAVAGPLGRSKLGVALSRPPQLATRSPHQKAEHHRVSLLPQRPTAAAPTEVPGFADVLHGDGFHAAEHHLEKPNHGSTRLSAKELAQRMAEAPIEIIRDHLIVAYGNRSDSSGEAHVVSVLCSMAYHHAAANVFALEQLCYDDLGRHESPKLRTIRAKSLAAAEAEAFREEQQRLSHSGARRRNSNALADVPADVLRAVKAHENDSLGREEVRHRGGGGGRSNVDDSDGNNGPAEPPAPGSEGAFIELLTREGSLDDTQTQRIAEQSRKMKKLAEKSVVSKLRPYPDVRAVLRKAFPDEFQDKFSEGKSQQPAPTRRSCPLRRDDTPLNLDRLLGKVQPVTLGAHIVSATALQRALEARVQSAKGAANPHTLLQHLLMNAEHVIIVIDARFTKLNADDYEFFNFLPDALMGKGPSQSSSNNPLAERLAAAGAKGCSVTPLYSDVVSPGDEAAEGAQGELKPNRKRRVPGERAPISPFKFPNVPGDIGDGELAADVELLMGGVVAIDVTCPGVKETSASDLFGLCSFIFETEQLNHAADALATIFKREIGRAHV